MGLTKLKIGDRVRVKPEKFFRNHPNVDHTGRVYKGAVFVVAMYDLCGKIGVIQDFSLRGNNTTRISFDYEKSNKDLFHYQWDDWMVELYEETDKQGNYLLQWD